MIALIQFLQIGEDIYPLHRLSFKVSVQTVFVFSLDEDTPWKVIEKEKEPEVYSALAGFLKQTTLDITQSHRILL